MSLIANVQWELVKTDFSIAANFGKKKKKLANRFWVLHSHYTNVAGSK